MSKRHIISYKNHLDSLFEDVKKISDPKMESEWAKYLCILVCGYLEQSISAIFCNYAQKKSCPNIANFIERQLEKARNPKMQQVIDLITKFNDKWGKEITEKTIDKYKDVVDGVVTNRNKIAHGIDVNISYSQIKNYYNDILITIKIIDDVVNK